MTSSSTGDPSMTTPDDESMPDRSAADTLSTIVDDVAAERHGQRIRAVGLALFTAFVIAGLTGWLGIRTGHARADEPGGLAIEVEYPQVARPGLNTVLSIAIHDPDGFAAPIDVSLPTSYVRAYDQNASHPEAAESTVDDERSHWTFDPPTGDTLTVWFDHRLAPGVQWRHDGDVTVTVASRTVRASFTTWVLP
ncbi:MAG TPA: hypothetical protein VFN21_06505 [Acidimicrobiales bacterium]|nr:hypothetical protein [Acidimicrobiales bacterium]